jgi:multisubunit Na+/H+ antiporter MnhB subunit
MLARVLSLIAGLVIGAATIILPLLFLSNEFQEAESAAQWGGHPELGKVGAIAAALVFVGISGWVTYRLLRFTATGRQSK